MAVSEDTIVTRRLVYFAKSLLLFCFSLLQEIWSGIPTRLNNIPHSRDIRKYFYDDVLQGTKRAIEDGKTRLKVNIC